MKPFLGDGSLAEYVTVSEQYGIGDCPRGLRWQRPGSSASPGRPQSLPSMRADRSAARPSSSRAPPAEWGHCSPSWANPDAATLVRLADDVLAGRLRVAVEQTIPLVEAATGFATFGAGTRGKVAVSVG
jgi:NADPH:quinone reductase-like Zn-dependent oxidoreductase